MKPMTAQEKASDLFNQHYMVLLFSDDDEGRGEELLVSILAQKHALITAKEMPRTLYWIEVIKCIEKL